MHRELEAHEVGQDRRRAGLRLDRGGTGGRGDGSREGETVRSELDTLADGWVLSFSFRSTRNNRFQSKKWKSKCNCSNDRAFESGKLEIWGENVRDDIRA